MDKVFTFLFEYTFNNDGVVLTSELKIAKRERQLILLFHYKAHHHQLSTKAKIQGYEDLMDCTFFLRHTNQPIEEHESTSNPTNKVDRQL